MSNSNITVFIEIYNEEQRIESCLKNFSWADELIVFDKQSTDKTKKIAEKYATKLISVPNTQASENIVKNISETNSCEWVFFVTASSLIHPKLVDEIIKLTSNPSFEYDVVALPYAIYAFGICNKKSPWSNPKKCTLIRRSVLKLSSKLHNEIGYSSNKIYNMPILKEDEVLYHCTHKDACDFFNRHMRYVDYEAKYFKEIPSNKLLRKSFFDIFRAFANIIVKKRSFMLGWDGVALGLAYISYFIMRFIYVWDLNRNDGNKIYTELRIKMDKLWNDEYDK